MNITYIIGNGFDIALGLKTRYADFYKSYLANNKGDSDTVQKFKKVLKAEKWSDAEWQFGQYDWDEFSIGPVKAFKECLTDFEDKFDAYLRGQNDQVRELDESKADFAKSLFKRMLQLGKFMNSAFANAFNQSLGNDIHLNFLDFNYTDVLERLVMTLPSNDNEKSRVFNLNGNNGPCVHVNFPYFVHGTLVRGGTVFGVDNLSQIKNLKVREYCEQNSNLVKPAIDRDGGYGLNDYGLRMLENSNVIVPYGVSFGATDKLWWSKLKSVVFDAKRMLVICPYSAKLKKQRRAAESVIDNLREQVAMVFKSLEVDMKPLTFTPDQLRGCVRLLNPVKYVDCEEDVDEMWDYLGLRELGDKILRKDVG